MSTRAPVPVKEDPPDAFAHSPGAFTSEKNQDGSLKMLMRLQASVLYRRLINHWKFRWSEAVDPHRYLREEVDLRCSSWLWSFQYL
jgi:hypothetical protein